MTLSILICSLYERAGMLAGLLRELYSQIEECDATDKVEVLTLIDSRERTTGSKRNELYEKAMGLYSVSIDDDDSIPPYFIEELLKACDSGADCFNQNGTIDFDGKNERKWCISIHNNHEEKTINGEVVYFRYPNHITGIKSYLAKQVLFPDIVIGEDYAWATELHKRKLLKSEYIIEKPIYFYRYRSKK